MPRDRRSQVAPLLAAIFLILSFERATETQSPCDFGQMTGGCRF